jgi:hypothetical protein
MPPAVATEVVTLTPALATHWLTDQRNVGTLIPERIDLFVADMREGRWSGPSVIYLDRAGRMLNGQHRCHAVIRSGVAIPVVIQRRKDAA